MCTAQTRIHTHTHIHTYNTYNTYNTYTDTTHTTQVLIRDELQPHQLFHFRIGMENGRGRAQTWACTQAPGDRRGSNRVEAADSGATAHHRVCVCAPRTA